VLKYLPVAILYLALSVLIYRLIPVIICRSDAMMQDIRKNLNDTQAPYASRQSIVWLKHARDLLLEAGIKNRSSCIAFAFIYLIPPVIFVIGNMNYAILASLCWICLINNLISSRAKKRSQHFGSLLYKIYRFINMELDSGLLLGDILISLPESTNDRELRMVLGKMSAAWQLTGNLDLAVRELDHIFGKHETAVLANNLRQCLVTGVAGRAFAQMESLLFARYIEHIRRKSKQLQQSLLISAVLGLLPVMIIMLWPIISEMLNSLSSIFI